MNKWVVRFWGVLALVALGALIGTSVWAGERGDMPDARLSDEALSGFLKTSDEKVISARVARSRADVEAGATRAPDERRVANVLLRVGVTGPGVQALLDLRGLSLVSLETKTPVPQTGTTVTIGMGQVTLSRFPGSVRDRVDAAMDFERAKSERHAQRLAGQQAARQQMLEFREVAESPHFAVYRIEVLGRREDLRPLLNDRRVRAVFVDEDQARIAEIDSMPLDGIMPGPPFLSAELAIPTGRLITDRPVKPNPQLAASATHAFFRTTDETYIARAITNAHARITTSSSSQPEARRAADVLLRRGFNAMEVGKLLTSHKLDYMSSETKSPVSDGSVMTHMTVAGGPIPRLPGTIAEQVERDIGRYRYQFEQRARMSASAEDAAHDRELARSPEVGVYRVEVAGTYRDLAELIKEPEVRGVVAELDGQRAKAFDDWLAEQRKNMRVIRTRRVLDPNDPLPPPTTPPLPPQ